MVSAASRLLQQSQLEATVSHDERFRLAAAADGEEELGVYGEAPLKGLAELLTLISESALLELKEAQFVDYGSGVGRVLLAAAAMVEMVEVVGIEAIEALHAVAREAISTAEKAGGVHVGVVSSVLGDGLPHESPAVAAVFSRRRSVTFMYSTAFPSEDGLRLPQLSASLAHLLPEGSVVVTTDKLLVGGRFVFAALLPMDGDDGERINAFCWRVIGEPHASYEAALAEVESEWMGEDACERSPEACEALLEQLERDGVLMEGFEDE